MKTDLVLTMNEYLDACCGIPRHVNPAAGDARHIPITDKGDIRPKSEAQGCRCDRWGHPCPDCLERKPQNAGTPRDFCSANKMEYVIAFGVVAMMGSMC